MSGPGISDPLEFPVTDTKIAHHVIVYTVTDKDNGKLLHVGPDYETAMRVAVDRHKHVFREHLLWI